MFLPGEVHRIESPQAFSRSFSKANPSHQRCQAMFCNQQIVLEWASFLGIGCNHYVFHLPNQNIWGTLHLPDSECRWILLLWLLVRSSRSKNFLGRSIRTMTLRSYVISPKISWWPGSSSRHRRLGWFGRKRVFPLDRPGFDRPLARNGLGGFVSRPCWNSLKEYWLND